MRPTTLRVSASTPKEALQTAAEALGVAQDALRLTRAGDGQFDAQMIHCDAEIDVAVAEDKMAATVIDSHPAIGSGQPLSFEAIGRKLREAGINVPPDPEAVKHIVQQLAAGRAVKGVVIAKGTPPAPAKDAHLDPIGDWKFPVFPGEPFGRYVPTHPGKDGVCVDGAKIPLGEKKKGAELLFPEDAACSIDKASTSNMVRAEHYGLATVEAQQVRVKPLLLPADDSMRIVATLHHKDSKGERITPQRLQQILARMDVAAPMDEDVVRKALERVERTGQPEENVTICRGVQPRDGKDGWFEMVAKTDRSSVGLETERGRVDFRARGVVRSVEPGELLGRLHPPELGSPGKDIYGRIIPAQNGAECSLSVGENVVPSADGAEFTAAISGMVFFVKNTLEVTEIFETSGDVDYSVGNISLEKGSVHVKGSILTGFQVESPRNVVVDQVIENAYVRAGGDVEVKGGILMDRGGRIEAQGSISGMFAHNATLQALGDVNIAHEISNCVISAGKMVLAVRGRGKIIGGTIRCAEGVVAKEIGSQLGVETTIYLGVDRKSEVDMARKKELEETLQKIYVVLGVGNIKTILENAPPDKRQAVAALLKTRLQCEQELREIENELAREREEVKSAANARIKAHTAIHPGVIVNCFGTSFKVDKTLPKATLFYDIMKGKIVTG